MYTIYHVFGKKVGCTTQYPKRCYQQGYKDGEFEVLELVDGTAKEAGDKEWEWADHFGYERGQHYIQNWSFKLTSEQRMEAARSGGKREGPISGRMQADLGKTFFQRMTFEQRSQAGKKAGKLGVTGFQTGAAGRVGGKISAQKNFTPEHQSRVGKIGGKLGGKRTTELGKSPFQTGVAQKASAASPRQVMKQLIKCVDHDIVSTLPIMKRWHKNCTLEKFSGTI